MSGPRTDWFSPQTIFGIVGMVAAFVSYCVHFERRITTAEIKVDQTRAEFARFETKLDRLVEREGK